VFWCNLKLDLISFLQKQVCGLEVTVGIVAVARKVVGEWNNTVKQAYETVGVFNSGLFVD